MHPYLLSEWWKLLLWALIVGFGFTLGAAVATSLIALLKRP